MVMRVTDEFGAMRTYANDPIAFTLEGPAELIGDNPFALIGGTGAVWIRAREQAGTVRLTAKHPRLGIADGGDRRIRGGEGSSVGCSP